MKGQSRSRSRARSPVSPKPKWKASSSDKCEDRKGANRKGGCKDKGEHKRSKTKTIKTHPTCKRRERYKLDCFAPPRGRAKRDQSDDDADDIFNESGLSPMDITVICPSTPISKPE